MTIAGRDLLELIFAHTRDVVATSKERVPQDAIERAARDRPAPLDFVGELRRAPCQPALIAEIKRASPSRGLLAPSLDPVTLAQTYRRSGAAAISVLTEERFFQGSLEDLRRVAALPDHPPLLRKDFICDPYQLFEARAAGADAVLLIASYLDASLLCELHRLATQLALAALVEVHDEADLERALACKPALIGINNRDLRTFTVSLAVTQRLAPLVPDHILVTAESGIFTPQHVQSLAGLRRDGDGAGVDAILVGEALVTAPDIAALTTALATAGRPNVAPPASAP